MTQIVLDSFNRSAALGSLWNIPAPGGMLVSSLTCNGQLCKTDTTSTASTVIWAHMYNTDPGINFGAWSVEAKRVTANVKAIGVVARAAVNTADRERIWFGFTNESGVDRFEIRTYTNHTAYLMTAGVTCASVGVTADLLRHTYRVTIEQAGTGLCNIKGYYDGALVVQAVGIVDSLNALGAATYRAVGVQAISGSTWAGATDYAEFDNAFIDDLAIPAAYATPTIEADAALTSLAADEEDQGLTVAGGFSILPDFGEIVSEQWSTVEATSEAGYTTTFAGVSKARRQWRLRWSAMTETNRDIVLADLAIVSGGTRPLLVYPAPDGNNYVVDYIEGTVNVSRVGPDVYNLEAQFEEVLT